MGWIIIKRDRGGEKGIIWNLIVKIYKGKRRG